jgi:molecular chaperone GrpE (heat shock protein)
VQLDADIMNRLVQIQGLAREILGKFDIQPEEIQVGRTSYDRRLHEATLARQSLQFPINTVIEVLRCGFRRMSTGEVLRRPQVVVARETA